jgi:hypothetical protein
VRQVLIVTLVCVVSFISRICILLVVFVAPYYGTNLQIIVSA